MNLFINLILIIPLIHSSLILNGVNCLNSFQDSRSVRSSFNYFPVYYDEDQSSSSFPPITQRPTQKPTSTSIPPYFTPTYSPPTYFPPIQQPQKMVTECDPRFLGRTICNNCLDNYIPFCATNGKTYRNKCQLQCARNYCDSRISIKFEGVCAEPYKPYADRDAGYKPITPNNGWGSLPPPRYG